jgi:hypothetical protein
MVSGYVHCIGHVAFHIQRELNGTQVAVLDTRAISRVIDRVNFPTLNR